MLLLLVGVGSAAILLDEPFGLREIAGAILIVSAGVVEVMRQQILNNSVIVDDPN
jgi:drug/metabolite transporter (DMT)-like permease